MRTLLKALLFIILALIAGFWFARPIKAQAPELTQKQIEETNNAVQPSKNDEPKAEAVPQPIKQTPKPITKGVQDRRDLPTKFASGYCTDYVARKVKVTWSGNANQWITNAKAQGYVVDMTPVKGAILVTNESRLGHVAYIEETTETTISISEWNYIGRYKTSYRTLDITNKIIKGIIHL